MRTEKEIKDKIKYLKDRFFDDNFEKINNANSISLAKELDISVIQSGKIVKLQAHRIKRGTTGGEYTLNNIIMLCPSCHKIIHSNEFRSVSR